MVDFTEPYYYASIVTLVKSDGKYADAKGISDLAGATCTSQLGTIWYDNCLPQLKDANIQPAQESAPAMLVALESDRTDLVATEDVYKRQIEERYMIFQYELKDNSLRVMVPKELDHHSSIDLRSQTDMLLQTYHVDVYKRQGRA